MADTDAMVFVVDDDDKVRKSLERLLRSMGRRVETFESAAAFLAAPPHDGPACLVLDVQMPGLTGLDLQAELDRQGRPTAIVFITGHGDIPMSVRAMKAGAVDFLPKPFGTEQLLEAIDRAIAQDAAAGDERAERGEVQQRVDALTPRELEVLTWVIRPAGPYPRARSPAPLPARRSAGRSRRSWRCAKGAAPRS